MLLSLNRYRLLALFIAIFSNQTKSYTQCGGPDSAALVALYNSTGGMNWTDNTGWLTTDCYCTWYGVICNSSEQVTYLDLDCNNLTGTIPPEIGDFTQLNWLDLYHNMLTGSLPAEIGQLSNLEYLNLYNNKLDGEIPPEIGDLAMLNKLDLHQNLFTGAIPDEICDLTNIVTIDLSDNQLSDSIPECIGNPELLSFVYLHINDLEGCYPASLQRFFDMRPMLPLTTSDNPKLPFSGDWEKAFKYNLLCGCKDTIYVTDPNSVDSSILVIANVLVHSNTPIPNNGQSVVHQAGMCVVLDTGFCVGLGTEFEASIRSCLSLISE